MAELRGPGVYMPVSEELLADSAGLTFKAVMAGLERDRVWLESLPEPERRRVLQARFLREAMARLIRTCPHCGCDPWEHDNG